MHSSIFDLDNNATNAILALNMILLYKIGNEGIRIPLAKEGESFDLYDNKLIIFGGDRNKYPFNDLYCFNLV